MTGASPWLHTGAPLPLLVLAADDDTVSWTGRKKMDPPVGSSRHSSNWSSAGSYMSGLMGGQLASLQELKPSKPFTYGSRERPDLVFIRLRYVDKIWLKVIECLM